VKSTLVIFALKCSFILYFAACTGINEYTTAVSATPHVTKGAWKVNLFTEDTNDRTAALDGYILTFEPTGKIVASKDGHKITGNWAEDDILKRITINLETKDPALKKLNDYWSISSVTKSGLSLQNLEKSSNGRLQITSL
jgi:hypothetical protein